MLFLFLCISFIASIIGAICGIGGGVIIKPVMDALGVMNVSTITFLSSFTVLCMSTYSVAEIKLRGKVDIKISISLPLSLGAVIGGLLGNTLFQYLLSISNNKNSLGVFQSISLLLITLGALVYTINKDKIKTYQVTNLFASLIIGMLLGMMSSFLGIGGGPINLVVLFFFFSMETKVAVENSLFIIFFSQLANILKTLLTSNVPEFEIGVLILMAFGGIFGGVAGRLMNKKINEVAVDRLFIGVMIFIIFINIYNVYIYL